MVCRDLLSTGTGPGEHRPLGDRHMGMLSVCLRVSIMTVTSGLVRIKTGIPFQSSGIKLTSVFRSVREAGDCPLYRLLLRIPLWENNFEFNRSEHKYDHFRVHASAEEPIY